MDKPATLPLHQRMRQRAYRDNLHFRHPMLERARELEEADQQRAKGMGIRAYMRAWTRALRAWLDHTGEPTT